MNLILLSCVLLIWLGISNIDAFEIPNHMKAQAKKLHKLCQKETSVNEELLQESSHGSVDNNRQLQCYFHCLLDKVGLIDDKNIMHFENMKELLPEEYHAFIDNLVNTCGTQAGADGCETAYRTVQCYMKTEPMLPEKFSFLFE